MARLVGALAHDGGPAYRPRRAWLDEDAVRAAYGARLLESWPDAFQRLLRRLEAKNLRPIPILTSSAHRLISLRFRHEGSLPYAHLIADEIRQFALKKGVILPPGSYGSTPEHFHHDYISLREAKKRTGLSRRKLANLAQTHGWLGACHLTRRCPIWFRISDIESISRNPERPVYLHPAATELGCSPQCMRRLIWLGHLPAAADKDFRDKRAVWHTTKNDIDRFRAEVRKHIVAADDGVSWRCFSRRHGSCSAFHGDVISSVITGIVGATAWPSDRLWDLKYEPSSLAAFVNEHVPTTSGSIESFADLSGIPVDTISAAANGGLLRHPRGHTTRILRSSFEHFFARYATVSMITGPKLAQVWTMRKALLRLGSTATRCKKPGRGFVDFYKRSDLMLAMEQVAADQPGGIFSGLLQPLDTRS